MFVNTLRVIRLGVAVAVVASLSACGSGPRVGAMTAPLDPQHIVAATSPLHAAVQVTEVIGGDKNNRKWGTTVDNDKFKQALEQSLSLQAVIAPSGAAKYSVNAELVELHLPWAGFDVTVTSKVHYVVTRLDDKSLTMNKLIEASYTANFSDALVAVERGRIASEGAVRENIKSFIATLAETVQAGPSQVGASH
ncbi:hypothetical protein [Azospirillum sp. B4]|uniref:hypothetical protein n=1 Tax=Azospirillum sp. B4 TaxID=95605 RepID=UPI0011DDC9E2|nr:hypothetical protein [Azospirillum sp. B4]